MIIKYWTLASATIVFLATPVVQAAAETRSCDAGYVATNRATGAEFVFGEFVARGHCNRNGDRCRELARNLAHDCMRDHWTGRWDRARPAKCRSQNVEGYRFDDLKGAIEASACHRGWGTSAPVTLRITGHSKGQTGKCRRQTELTDSYRVTPEICASITSRPTSPPSTRREKAWTIPPSNKRDAMSNLRLPAEMPSIRYPKGFNGCSSAERRQIRRAWALAHYSTWIADGAMDWMKRNGPYRKAAWEHGLRTSGGFRTINYAARAWFGPMNGESFGEASGTVGKLWGKRFRGKTFTVSCRTNDDGRGAHPCYRRNPGTGRPPGANHLVYGRINFCAGFFAADRDDWSRARTVAHELLHWMTSPSGRAILDTHTHCHGGGRCSADKGYGREAARHLANYDGGTGIRAKRRRINHRKRALRNNDNYAWFIHDIGRAAYDHGWARNVGLEPLRQFPADGFRW